MKFPSPRAWNEDRRITFDDQQAQYNEKLACGYWTVVKSLQLPK